MLKYQLGSGIVTDRERIVLGFEDTYVDLLMLVDDMRSRRELSREIEAPVSLMNMMDCWSLWREELPRIVEYASAQRSKGKLRSELDEGDIRWLPPLMYPRKLICVGTNYRDHLSEIGMDSAPPFPFKSFKPPTTTLLGSGRTLALPRLAKKVDWEAELAVVIGKKARAAQGQEALDTIAGFSIINDVSARDWLAQASALGVDMVLMKAFDGFAPMGPFITPAEFVPDPQSLDISLTVNGVVKQQSNTSAMIFSVRQIVEHLASIMTLEPGDVISTGTPSGVGVSREPPEFLQSGDHMVVEIEGLGHLETPVERIR